jgi:membrane associated rhomboid family serine protease
MRRGTLFGDFPVTSAIFILCLIFYGMEAWDDHVLEERPFTTSLITMRGFDPRITLELGANNLLFLKAGQLWRLIAAAFLHGNALHIAMNLMVLLDLGRLCEPMLGRERFGVVYIASAIGGSLGSAGWSWIRGGFPATSVGASGAIVGLIGLLLGFSLRHKDRELRDQILRSVIYMVLFTTLIPHVDHAGHAGGFITGALFGFFTPRYISSGGAKAWRIPFLLAALATLASLGFPAYYFMMDLVR